jgi:hypothetical protein
MALVSAPAMMKEIHGKRRRGLKAAARLSSPKLDDRRSTRKWTYRVSPGLARPPGATHRHSFVSSTVPLNSQKNGASPHGGGRRGVTHRQRLVSSSFPFCSQKKGASPHAPGSAPGNVPVPGLTHLHRSVSNVLPRSSQNDGTSAHVPDKPPVPGLTHLHCRASRVSPRNSQNDGDNAHVPGNTGWAFASIEAKDIEAANAATRMSARRSKFTRDIEFPFLGQNFD